MVEGRDSDLIGRVLAGHYRLDGLLGEGATGIVFRARHTLLDQQFAVKVLNPALAGDAEVRARFLREARTLTHLVHKHAVQVRHCGEDGDLLFLVMDLVEGEPLSAVLRREGRLDELTAARVTLQVLDALEEAHRAGIVHRDLKPANLMVDGDDVYVLDFGLARICGTEAPAGTTAEVTIVGTLVGTIAYMSPEQLRAEQDVDGRSDLFSVGVMLHEMLTGERPFGGGSPATILARVLHEAPREFPEDVAGSVSPAMRAVLKRALAKDRSDRFQSATEFAAGVRAALAGKAPTGPARSPRRRSLRSVAELVVLAVLLVVLWSLVTGPDTTEGLRRTAHSAFLEARFENAIALFSEVIRRGDATAQDFLGRGRAYAELSRAEALADLTTALERAPGDPVIRVEKARYLWRVAGQAEEARDLLQQILTEDPSRVDARLERAWMWVDAAGASLFPDNPEGRLEAARAELEGLSKYAPDDARLLVLEAEIGMARASPDAEQARALAEQAVDQDERLAQACSCVSDIWAALGTLERERGRESLARRHFEQAVDWASRAIDRAREYPSHHVQGRDLIRLLRQRLQWRIALSDYEGAAADIDDLLAWNPLDPGGLEHGAYSFTQIGEYERAHELYERLVEIAADDPMRIFHFGFSVQGLADSRVRRGEPDAARASYQRALEIYRRGLALAPVHPNLRNYRAETYVRLAQLTDDDKQRAAYMEEAKRDFEALEPESVSQYRLAGYYLVAGEPVAALEVLRPRVEESGTVTPAELARFAVCLTEVARLEAAAGRIAAADGHIERAIDAYRFAGERDPEMSGPAAWQGRGVARRAQASWTRDDDRRHELLEESLDAFRTSARIGQRRPDVTPESHFLAAEVLLDLGREEEAVEEGRRAIALRQHEARRGEWYGLEKDRLRLEDILARAAASPSPR